MDQLRGYPKLTAASIALAVTTDIRLADATPARFAEKGVRSTFGQTTEGGIWKAAKHPGLNCAIYKPQPSVTFTPIREYGA